MLLEIVLSLCIIIGVILTTLGYFYVGISLLIVGTIIFSYLLYNYFKNNTALEILRLPEGETRLFDKLCDKLFRNEGDKEIYKQYIDMKQKRSQYESQNLCKNFAKVKSKQI